MIERRLKLEALERRLLLASDFGDAPEPYDTLLADGGASHVIDTTATTLFLGAGVDSELDGTPSANADGDDRFTSPGRDDEDGIVEPARDLVLTIGSEPRVRVRATNLTGSEAMLYGWIDYNQDGVFDNATERSSMPVPDGSDGVVFTLQFPAIPIGSPFGETFARFRLSTDVAAADAVGIAADGEVEDYSARQYAIADVGDTPTLWSKLTENDLPSELPEGELFGNGATSVGDINGDGIGDLALGIPGANNLEGAIRILYLDSDGSILETALVQSGETSGLQLNSGDRFGNSIARLGDLDGDGIAELAVGALGDIRDGNPQSNNLGAVHVLFLNPNGSVRRSVRIGNSLNGGPELSGLAYFGTKLSPLGDLDGDGILDLAVAAQQGVIYILLMNFDGTAKSSVPIDQDGLGSSIASLGDINGDGITDIAVGAPGDDTGFLDSGATYLLQLNESATVDQYTKLANGHPDIPLLEWRDNFGTSLASIGDIDGNGINDLAVTAPGDNDVGIDHGVTYIFLLGDSGTVVESFLINSRDLGYGNGDQYTSRYTGTSITDLGDFNGDGLRDIAISALKNSRESIHIISLTPDSTAPRVEGIRRSAPAYSPTAADELQFHVRFTEDVFYVDKNDFVATGGSGATVETVAQINPRLFELTLQGGSLANFNGLVGIDLAPDASIEDRTGLDVDHASPVINEQFEVVHFLADFGDAPAPYPTRYSIGAWHLQNASAGPRFGSIVDAEPDGVPSYNAIGDGADEDGVVFSAMRGGQTNASVTIHVQGDSGIVDAWIDFNGDGSWGGVDEKVISNRTLEVGETTFNFGIPSWAVIGETFARFRISSEGSSAPTGSATDGEVEDYQVTLLAPAPGGTHFVESALEEDLLIEADAITTADLDRDGDIDVITSRTGQRIYWHDNLGDKAFNERLIYDGTGQNPITSVEIVDLNGDGHLDLVSANEINGTITWHKNDGNQAFSSFLVASQLDRVRDIALADLNGDGLLDVLSASNGDGRINWFENNGDDTFSIRAISPFSITWANNIAVADLDRDGDLDTVAGGIRHGLVTLYINDGHGEFSPLTVGEEDSSIRDIVLVDFDHDGDSDLLVARSTRSDGSVTWYENQGNLDFQEHTIIQNSRALEDIVVADFNGDMHFDIAAAASDSDTVRWYESDGQFGFIEHILRDFYPSSSQIDASDIDNDGDLDLTTGGAGTEVRWYENKHQVDLQSEGGPLLESSDEVIEYIFTLSNAPRLEPTLVRFAIKSLAIVDTDFTLIGAASFDGVEGAILIPSGELTAKLQVAIIDDTQYELDEPLSILLVAAQEFLTDNDNSNSWTIISEEYGGDFGDAAGPYPTTVANNGAAHSQGVPGSPRLGSTIDYEQDGQLTLQADGDNDDGVTWSEIRVGQNQAEFVVDVQNAPNGARLDAWLDFNGDGSWQGGGERIASSLAVVEGNNTVRFSVPADILSGHTYARFRLSTLGGLSATGIAADGEVEDYQVEVLPPRPSVGFSPTENEIDFDLVGEGSEAIVATDLDDDDDLDIVAVSGEGLVWFENDSEGNFAKHVISTGYSSVSIIAIDLDRDGDKDLVVSGSYIGWFENDGQENFVDSGQITSYGTHGKEFDVVDLDGDGDLDVLAPHPLDERVHWYENDGAQTFISHTIVNSIFDADNPQAALAEDFDNDGDLDIVIVSAGFFGELAWYRNDGQQNFSNYQSFSAYSTIHTVDLDNDGDVDVLAGNGAQDRIDWFVNDGAGFMHRESISTEFDGPESFSVSDIDGDGDFDILVASAFDDGLAILENTGKQRFERKVISPPETSSLTSGLNRVIAGDLDNDGDLDILAGARFGNSSVWFESIPDGILAEPSQTILDEIASNSSTIVFSRAGNLTAELVFQFEVGGTAEFATDYQITGATSFDASTGSVTFLAGESTASLTITPIPDDNPEDNETVILRLYDSQLASSGTVPTELQPTVTILRNEPVDYGDAPASYSTDSLDAPAHVPTGPTLGSLRDAEIFGQPTAGADGDGADEDGVTFSPIRLGQVDATATVNVQNAPTGARLDAWFDFDGDGNFNGVDELVAARLEVVEGDNLVRFSVPAGVHSGETFVRFRLSTEGGLSSTGFAADGEIEDYQVTLLPPASTGGAFSNQGQVGNSPIVGQLLEAADLDGDGDLDLVTAGFELQLQWHEHVGNGGYLTHDITAEHFRPNEMQIVDFDRDGDLDIVSLGDATEYVWFENDGSQSFTEHMIANADRGAHNLTVADVDGDGDLDILATEDRAFSSQSLPHRALWHENLGDGTYFTRQIATLDDDPFAIKHLAAGDLDNDGDLDLVVGPTQDFGRGLDWYENDGIGSFTRHELAPTFPSSNSIALPFRVIGLQLQDLNRDGNLDLVYNSSLSYPGWMAGDGAGGFVRSGAVLSDRASNNSLHIFDVDGDTDLDWLHSLPSNGSVAWYSNDGAAAPRLNLGHQLSTDTFYFDSEALVDFDGDGDIDILTVRTSDRAVVWHENIAPNAGDFDSSEEIDGFDFLAWQRGHGTSSDATQEQGDADGDGDVQADDLNDWSGTYGYSAPVPTADFDSNEEYDGRDFLDWQRGFGIAVGAGSTAGDADLDGDVDGDDLSQWHASYGREDSPESPTMFQPIRSEAEQPSSSDSYSLLSNRALVDAAMAMQGEVDKPSYGSAQELEGIAHDDGFANHQLIHSTLLNVGPSKPSIASSGGIELPEESASEKQKRADLLDSLFEKVFN